MTTKTILKLAAAAVAIAMPALASATTMTVTYDPDPNTNPNSTLQNVSVSFNALAQNPTWGNYGAGRLAFQVNARDPLDPVGAYIYTFCIEPTQTIANAPAQVVYNVDPLAQSTLVSTPTIKLSDASSKGIGTKAALVNQLLARAYASSGIQYLQQGTTISADVATALQFAIWEVIDETTASYDVTAGSAQMKVVDTTANYNGTGMTHQSYVSQLANSYLSALTSGGPTVNGLFALDNSNQQNQVAQYNVTTTPSRLDVPEPGMLGLFGLGAVALGLGRRRKAA